LHHCHRAGAGLGAGGDQEATQTEAFGLDDPETLLTRYNLTAILHEAAVAEAAAGAGGTPGDVDGAPERALASRAGRRPSHWDRVQELEASVKQVVEQQAVTHGPAHPATLRMRMVGLAPLLASRGNAAAAKEVLETSMQLLVVPGDADLLAAAGDGDPAVVRALLESGADPGLGGTDGTTPLMAAAAAGHAVVLRTLLEVGAPVEAADGGGWTALHWSCHAGQHGASAALLAAGADADADTDAAHRGGVALGLGRIVLLLIHFIS
jgi:hypothetical protein